MATDVDVQYFSHLNGLTLGNNWGDLIRLLDKALVTGIDFTQITAASIDPQGDVHITLYAAHNAMLFQVGELSGFSPASLNQKYRIKGVPSTTELILKPALDIAERSITTIGAGKLASLGYEIIFRDANDVKRVYRAKNPTDQHPFIRVDESLTSPDGSSGVYSSTYAKFAMVGLLERMDHIDDYQNPNVLQLPFDPVDPAKNWKITGTGTAVVRGWASWVWNSASTYNDYMVLSGGAPARNINFTLVGDADTFYLLCSAIGQVQKQMYGCGIYNSSLASTKPSHFLFAQLGTNAASVTRHLGNYLGSSPLHINESGGAFWTHNINPAQKNHTTTLGITHTLTSGVTNIAASNTVPAIEIPIRDAAYLKGGLKHIGYLAKNMGLSNTSPIADGSSIYVFENVRSKADNQSESGGFAFYLGEIT